MSDKNNPRQRAISDHDFPNTISRPLSLRLIEANLEINVAKIGSMHPYAKIYYGNEVWKSDSASNPGMSPKWNSIYKLPSAGNTIQLILFHKAFLIGDIEIGRCTISLSDVMQGHLIE